MASSICVLCSSVHLTIFAIGSEKVDDLDVEYGLLEGRQVQRFF